MLAPFENGDFVQNTPASLLAQGFDTAVHQFECRIFGRDAIACSFSFFAPFGQGYGRFGCSDYRDFYGCTFNGHILNFQGKQTLIVSRYVRGC